MQEFTPWLGICHLRQVADDSPDTQPTLAAVWADSVESFEREMHVHTNSHGLQMIWAEGVVVADEWLAKHPDRKDGQRLVDKVSAKHLVEIGGFGAGATGLGADGLLDGDTEGYLHIEEIEVSSLPDQSGLPFWEQDWIAPDLKALLFGQDDDSKELLRTYLIVDATLRKNITGVFDLDTLDVPVRCLFKGDAAETMKEAAPYLINVTLPDGAGEDNDLVPAFHKSFFDKHWGQNTGIFIRTTASMDEVWAHFRKFTKAQMEEDGRWVFFRFWDPRIAEPYFKGRTASKESVEQWFGGATLIAPTIICEINHGKLALHFCPDKRLDLIRNTSAGALVLTEQDLAPFKSFQVKKATGKITTLLKGNFGQDLRHLSDELLLREVGLSIERMQGYGLRTMDNLYITSAWAAFYGHDFETKDPEGTMLMICNSDLSETEKMSALRKRITNLNAKETAV